MIETSTVHDEIRRRKVLAPGRGAREVHRPRGERRCRRLFGPESCGCASGWARGATGRSGGASWVATVAPSGVAVTAGGVGEADAADQLAKAGM